MKNPVAVAHYLYTNAFVRAESATERFLLWFFCPFVWLDFLVQAVAGVWEYRVEMRRWRRTGLSAWPYRCQVCGVPTRLGPTPAVCPEPACLDSVFRS